jgi:hypothetical protein
MSWLPDNKSGTNDRRRAMTRTHMNRNEALAFWISIGTVLFVSLF